MRRGQKNPTSHLHIFSEPAFIDAFRRAAAGKDMTIRSYFELLVSSILGKKDEKLEKFLAEREKNQKL